MLLRPGVQRRNPAGDLTIGQNPPASTFNRVGDLVVKKDMENMNNANTYKPATFAQILDILQDFTETLHAVEVLEYQNKNWLGGDNKTRSEERQLLLKNMLEKIAYLKSKNPDSNPQ